MIMNMPPPYHQSSYLQRPPQGYSNVQPPSNFNARYETSRPAQQSIPQMNVNNSYSPNLNAQYAPNRSYSPFNAHSQINNSQSMNGVPQNVPRQNIGGQYSNPQIDQRLYEQIERQNNFTRQPQVYPQYLSPNSHQVYPKQSFQPQPQYQQPNYTQYQGPMSQTYSSPYYNQQTPQNYVPLYTPQSGLQSYQPINSMLYKQFRRNVPEQSINSNFNYEHANFDCNYSVEQNLVHCVLCNQTYKTSQRKQHLELHREKVKNVNIRPVDQKQLKRLQKYNSMTKKGLMVKPIVEPDEFNVQYNPNEFVLRKVTQYRDIDAPRTNEVQIQTGQNLLPSSRPQDLGYSESRRSQASSPQRRSNKRQQSPTVVPNRNTNTRFNADSVREEEQIFLSDRFDHHEQGDTFKSNYNADQSLRESDRRSQGSQKLGYGQSPGLKARNAESINRPQDLGYKEDSQFHSIREDEEQYRNSNQKDIPINEIVNEVNRRSSQ